MLCIVCRNVKCFGKQYWDYSKKLKIELPCDLEIPLWNIYPEEWKTEFQRYWHSHVHFSIIHNNQEVKKNFHVHPFTGDQSLVFIGRTDIEAETSILWPPDAKS